MGPGAGAGDGISGGFHFPIYTFRFSLNQRRLARANLVSRKEAISRFLFFLKKQTKEDVPTHPRSLGKLFVKSKSGVCRAGAGEP